MHRLKIVQASMKSRLSVKSDRGQSASWHMVYDVSLAWKPCVCEMELHAQISHWR